MSQQDQVEVKCPGCGARHWVERAQVGGHAACGQCGQPLRVAPAQAPATAPAATALAPDAAAGQPARTISAYLRGRGLRGGVSLEDVPGSTPADVLETDGDRKYVVGRVLAAGGMGAILDCRDLNVRRSVAMKVMLDPEGASEPQILRFIEEAQVTGQLEHPGVVPVHDLGVDAAGRVYYTMKFVRGRTLKNILSNLARADADTVAAFPLNRLLTIFLRVCDAVAYAHHKHVLHRDLKPENIMVGDFGEVYVMDWGLAKVLQPTATNGREAERPVARAPIDRARNDVPGTDANTLAGAVMGTPVYMAPEQAQGLVETLDARADVYALGGILYELLALRRAVDGQTALAILTRVARGELTPLPADTDPRARPHCPGGRIPEALGAVARKALALAPEHRYRTVQELKADIEAYQAGFATAAEQAGLGRLLLLFLRRHRTFALSAAAIVLALAVGLSAALVQWRKAVRAEAAAGVQRRAAESARDRAEKALEEAEQASYYNAVALAEARIKEALFTEAEATLWATPPARRGWEWGNLLLRCHQDLLTLPPGVTDGVDVCFSPDGRCVLVTGNGDAAVVWDTVTEKAKFTLTHDSGRSTTAAWAPDGNTLLTGALDGSVRLWDARTGTLVRTFGAPNGGVVYTVAYSPDSRRIAVGQHDGRVSLWDAAQGNQILAFAGESKHPVARLEYSPDGAFILAAHQANDPTRVWDAVSGEQRRVLPGGFGVACFSPDGRSVAVNGPDPWDTLQILDLEGKVGPKTLRGHQAAVTAAAFSPNGRLLATGGVDKTVRVWEVRTGKGLCVLHGHSRRVVRVAFSPDGRTIASSGEDGLVKLWSAQGSCEPRQLGYGRSTSLALSPGGDRLLCTWDVGGEAVIWDLRTGLVTGRLAGGQAGLDWVAWSKDGQRVMTVTSDHVVSIWDPADNRLTASFPVSGNRERPALSPDGTCVVTGGDQAARVWDVATGRVLRQLPGVGSQVAGVAWSPDGKSIVTADGEVRLWNAGAAHVPPRTSTAGEDGVSGPFAVSADSRWLAGAGTGGKVFVWELPSLRLSLAFSPHSADITALTLSPDGRLLATSDEGNVKLWDAVTGRQLLSLPVSAARSRSLDFAHDGKTLAVGDYLTPPELWHTLDGKAATRESMAAIKRERYRRWLAEQTR